MTRLGSAAFSGCLNLRDVSSLGRIIEIETLTFKDCVSLTDVCLPNTLEIMGSSCFFHCPQLTNLTLPQAINTIDEYAFSYCGIKAMNVKWQTPIEISENVFNGINLSKATLYIPLGSKRLYENSHSWCSFGNIVELVE